MINVAYLLTTSRSFELGGIADTMVWIFSYSAHTSLGAVRQTSFGKICLVYTRSKRLMKPLSGFPIDTTKLKVRNTAEFGHSPLEVYRSV